MHTFISVSACISFSHSRLQKDELVTFPDSRHIVVLKNGHFFSLDVLDEAGTRSFYSFQNEIKFFSSAMYYCQTYAYSCILKCWSPTTPVQLPVVIIDACLRLEGLVIHQRPQRLRFPSQLSSSSPHIFPSLFMPGCIKAPEMILSQLRQIEKKDCIPPEHPVTVLTADNRDFWCKAREALINSGKQAICQMSVT